MSVDVEIVAGMPKELIDKAEAIGVFPKVSKETAYFSTVTQGYGVISARKENGWTMPAFYSFGGGGYGSPFAKNETNGVILLFMTKDAVVAFEKGGVPLKGEKKALAGPVGAITNEQKRDLADAHIRALEHLRQDGKSDFLNLGTGRGFSVLEVIDCIREVTGREILVQIESPRPGDPSRLIADPTKAKAVLGWEPVMSDLRSIVRSAWEWRVRLPSTEK